MPRSLTTRTAVAATALASGIVLAAFVATYTSAQRNARDGMRRSLDQSADLVAQFLAGRERTLLGGARVFVQSPYFRTLVAEQQRDDLLDQAFEAAEQLGANWVFITDERGTLVAKSDEPNASGVAMGNVPLVATALRGGTATGFGVSGDTALFQAVALPVLARAGAPTGVLVAVRLVDSAFIDDVRAATGSDLLLYVRDATGVRRPIASTVGAPRDLMIALAARDAGHEAVLKSVSKAAQTDSVFGERGGAVDERGDQERSGSPSSTIRVGPQQFDAYGATLATAGGEPVGGFLVLRESVSDAAVLSDALPPLLAATIAAALAVLLATRWVRLGVVVPLRAIAATVDAAADDGARPVDGFVVGGAAELHVLQRAVRRLLSTMQDAASLTPLARLPHSAHELATSEQIARPDAPTALPGSRPRTVGRRALALFASNDPAPQVIQAPLAAGELLAGRYQLQGELGRGGHGTVYRAFDRVLGEPVAIKRLRGDVIGAHAGSLDALTHETRLTRRLTHRNIVRVFDLVTTDGAPFLTMEYVDGASLGDVVAARGRLDATAVLAIARQLLRGLSYAHEQGITHGDLKPRNLLIDTTGVLKLADFGVARFARELAQAGAPAAGRPLLAGAIVGTPEYMAPEQLLGAPATARSDLYAAGVVLQECLEGITPYAADTPMAFVARKLADESNPRRQFQLSGIGAAGLESLVIELTAVDPDRRPTSAGAALERLA